MGEPNPTLKSRFSIGLAVILLLAASLRLIHINWGLPLIEEEAFPLFNALQMSGWASGEQTFDPDNAGWPSLSFYTNMAIQHAHYLLGGFESRAAYWQAFTEDKTTLVVLSRGFGALLSLLAVWVTWRLARHMVGVLGAILASGLMALSPLALRYAQEITPEMLVLVASTFALWYLVRIGEQGQLRDYVLFGLAVGLGISAKYTPGLFLPAFYSVHLLRRRGEGLGNRFAGLNDRRLWTSLAVTLLAFALTSPYLVANPESLKSGLSYQASHMTEGHLGEEGSSQAFGFYFLRVLVPAFGWPAALLGVLGLAWCAWKERGPWISVGLAFLSYMVVVGFFSTRFDRYLFPVLPALALGAAGALIPLQAIGKNRSQSMPVLVGAGIVLLSLVPTSLGAMRYHQDISRESTKAAAKAWVDTNTPKGSMVAVEFQTLPFYESQVEPSSYFTIFLPLSTDIPEASGPFYDVRWYEDFHGVVVGSNVGDRYRASPDRFAKQVAFYDALESRWTKAASFSGNNYRGPDIVIYRNPGQTIDRSMPLDPQLFAGLQDANPNMRRRFLSSLGDCYANAGQTVDATWIYDQFRSLCPDCPEAYERLSVLGIMIGEYELAARAALTYLQGKPEDHEMRLNLAFAMDKAGQAALALEEVNRVLASAPSHPVANQFRDELVQKLGNPE